MSTEFKSVNRPKRAKNDSSTRVSLHGLEFVTAVRAAMATGKPPKAKPMRKRQPKKK